MQDEIAARLASTLNAQLSAAEARRAEQAPNPNSVDLYFQGLARAHEGTAPDNLAQARSFFDRALSADSGNVDALIGSARVDELEGGSSRSLVSWIRRVPQSRRASLSIQPSPSPAPAPPGRR